MESTEIIAEHGENMAEVERPLHHRLIPNLTVRNLLLVGLAYFIIAKYVIKK